MTPSTQPRIPWWRRRRYEKRANVRRGALAQALPAPDPGTRVDVHGNPAPLHDRWPPGSRPGSAHAGSPNPSPSPYPNIPDAAPTLGSEETTSRKPNVWATAALCVASAAGVIVAVAVGAPVLGHSTRWLWIAAGMATALVFAWLAYEPLTRMRGRTALLIAGIPALLTALFTLGAFSNPVVVNGQVQPSWSSAAQSYKYAVSMRASLDELAQMDVLMGADNTQAWARRADLEEAKMRAEEIGLAYQARLDAAELPDAQFVAPTGQLADSAYAASRALELRLNVLDTKDEPGLVEEFDSARSTYQEEWSAAASGLGAAMRALDLPIPPGEGS